MIKKIAILTLVLISFNANSACTRADLNGNWVFFNDDGATFNYCTVPIVATSNLASVAGTCFYPAAAARVFQITSFATDCKLIFRSRLAAPGIEIYQVTAWVDAGKTVAAGGWILEGNTEGGLWHGVKH